MSNTSSTILSSVAIAMMSAAGLAGFKLYSDVELLKLTASNMERTMEERKETTERFTAMMLQMDKTLAVHTEAVNTLKDAVKRIEIRTGYAYVGENHNDSRD